jgi:hypothetical protein
MKHIVILILGCLLSLPTSLFGGVTPDWYKVANSMPTGTHYLENKSENLCWGEAYSQNAILDLFEVGRDTTLLDEMVIRLDGMIGTMWDVPPDIVPCNRAVYRDGFLGWGSTYYDPNKYYQEYMVHDGMIIYPVIRFVRYVYRDSSLYSVYGNKADGYLRTIEANIIKKWYVNWKGTAGQSGLELEHWGGFQYLPHNQYLIFAAALLALLDMIDDPHYTTADPVLPQFYQEKSAEMCSFFKNYLVYRGDKDCYFWGYWGAYSSGVEDFSHGYMDILTVLEAYQHSVVFVRTDLDRFTNTFTEAIWNGNMDSPFISGAVDGSSSDNQGYFSWVWTSLCEFDFRVWEVVNSYHEKNFSKRRKEGVARLALETQRFDIYPPAPPSSLSSVDNGNGTNTISWKDSAADEDGSRLTGLAGYNIYRALSPDGPFEKINGEVITSNSYITVDRTGYYAATAVDYHRPANESKLSGVITSVKNAGDHPGISSRINLMPNYPNPFNSSTWIPYSVTGASKMRTKIEVYSIDGRLVKILMDGEKAPGEYAVEWDGTDRDHRTVTSGIYIYSLSNGLLRQTRTMVYLK